MAERISTSSLGVSKALPVSSYIHGMCCFWIQWGVWVVPSSTTAPRLRHEAALGEPKAPVIQDLPEAYYNQPTNPQFLMGTLETAASLSTYRQTAGRGQGFPGDDLRLGEWERAQETLKAPFHPKLQLLQDRNGVETETTRELMLLPFCFKEKKNVHTESSLCPDTDPM